MGNTAKYFSRNYSNRYAINEERMEYHIRYGEDDLFPQKLIWLFNHCSINGACIKAKTEATIGNGLICDQDYILDYANPKESWNDIYRKIALDYNLFGGFALEVIWSQDRTKIAEVYHVDFSFVRAQHKNHRGEVDAYYVSALWNSSYGIADIHKIPAYNPENTVECPKQLLYHAPYRPGLEYYPLPDYMGAVRVIELDVEVDNFHVNNVRNGLAPSLAITTFTDASSEEKEWIERALRAQYAGSHNAGSLLYMDVPSQDQAPIITPIPANGNDAYYEIMHKIMEQKILTGHRITSPMILGIKTEGQLGGRDEMMDAYLLFMNTVINPKQADILGCLEKLLEVNYGDVTLGVETTQLFDDGSVETDVVVSNESTQADSKDLEVQTITEQTTETEVL